MVTITDAFDYSLNISGVLPDICTDNHDSKALVTIFWTVIDQQQQ